MSDREIQAKVRELLLETALPVEVERFMKRERLRAMHLAGELDPYEYILQLEGELSKQKGTEEK